MIPRSRNDLGNSSPAGKCILSGNVEIEGSITFQKELLIDGKVQGQITSDGVLTGSETWTDPKYAPFHNYHHELHDADSWRHHHTRIMFVFGGGYYWNAGY